MEERDRPAFKPRFVPNKSNKKGQAKGLPPKRLARLSYIIHLSILGEVDAKGCQALDYSSLEGGLPNPFSAVPFLVASTNSLDSILSRLRETNCSPTQGRLSSRERSDRAGTHRHSGILQQAFCCQEGLGGLEARPGCQRPQQVCLKDKIFNGDHTDRAFGPASKRLDGDPGHEGCLFPYSNPSSKKYLQTPTTSGVPRRSPIQVLTRPNVA